MRLLGSMMYRSPCNVVSWPYDLTSEYHPCRRAAFRDSTADQKYWRVIGTQTRNSVCLSICANLLVRSPMSCHEPETSRIVVSQPSVSTQIHECLPNYLWLWHIILTTSSDYYTIQYLKSNPRQWDTNNGLLDLSGSATADGMSA